ncbi:MAG: 3-deoxy-manno-octulosonate cytidylyltransferase [Phaeospirillum sp.]|nr:3-deoxy-manno-octulosonate cytidylyltransferase [Phaeospirillum sp.]
MKIVAMIPARMGSSRFPGKPLAPILGRSMIEHVTRRTAMSKSLCGVYVATCDQEIADAVAGFGGTAIMTSDRHERASDRIAEAMAQVEADIVVMVQGDEPMVHPDMIDEAVAPMLADPSIRCVNLTAPIETEEEFLSPNSIKVVMDLNGDALYMSREPIPTRFKNDFARMPVFKQVCIMPFRREALTLFTRLSPTPLEITESIDMNRFLEHGVKVRMVPTRHASQAVDTPEDLERVARLMADDPLASLSGPKT